MVIVRCNLSDNDFSFECNVWTMVKVAVESDSCSRSCFVSSYSAAVGICKLITDATQRDEAFQQRLAGCAPIISFVLEWRWGREPFQYFLVLYDRIRMNIDIDMNTSLFLGSRSTTILFC